MLSLATHQNRDCVAPTTEQELIEREFQLNCLQHAAREREDIEFCFLEANNKQILEHFVAVCDDVAKSDLRTRMKVIVNGFRPLLSEAIAATGKGTCDPSNVQGYLVGDGHSS